MRRLLLILLIVLLPVRALAGDWMMLGMSMPDQAAGMPGCDMQLVLKAAQGSDDAASSASADVQCAQCDLCIPAASPPVLAQAAGLMPAPSLRPAAGSSFASAALSQDLRPPAR